MLQEWPAGGPALLGEDMAVERVPSQFLRAGDVIHIWHRHEPGGGACLSHWEIDAEVTEDPLAVGPRVAVKWASGGRDRTGRPAVTGINMLWPGELVVRVRRVAAGST